MNRHVLESSCQESTGKMEIQGDFLYRVIFLYVPRMNLSISHELDNQIG